MNKTWITVKETATILGFEESTIRKKATKHNEYEYRYVDGSSGQGGKRMEILLESLPKQAQLAYHNKKGDIQPVINTEYTHTTKAQKEKGKLKATAIQEYKQFRKACITDNITSETKIKESYVEKWNHEHPNFKISMSSFYRWLKLTKRGNPDKLVDKRGGYNRGKSTIPEFYEKYFNTQYLRQTQPSVNLCYRLTQALANKNGDMIPGIKAFQNLVKNYPPALAILYREGEKAYHDKCEPYADRDYTLIEPNEWWVADHHEWDIFVRVPDGQGGWMQKRPWGSYWMDMRTRKVISSIIRIESPNSDIVLCSFGLGVKKHGIPKGVRLDNGKDYKANDLFQSDELDNVKFKFCKSVAENLMVDYTYAIPYNAQAKPIERLFNTFESQLGKLYSSYAGSNAKKRPENLKKVPIENIITLEEFIKQHNQYVYEIYNNTPHSGKDMFHKSPDYMYNTLHFTPQTMKPEALFFSLLRVKGKRTFDKHGVTFQYIHYENPNFQQYFGKEVIAKYDPTQPELLYIFDLEENFLFTANKSKKRSFNLTKEDYQEIYESKKIAKQVIMNTYNGMNTAQTTETVKELLQIQEESLEKTLIEKPKTAELVRNFKMEENARKANLSEIQRNYEMQLEEQKKTNVKVSETQQKMKNNFKNKMIKRVYDKEA